MALSGVQLALFSLVLTTHYFLQVCGGRAVDEVARELQTESVDLPPLYLALEANQTANAWQLLEKGASPDQAVQLNGCSTPLLHLSVQRNESYVTVQLFRIGANLNSQDCHNLTAINTAILEGKMGIIREVVSAGYDLNWQPSGSDNALIFAVRNDKQAELQVLLELGADINCFDSKDQTPLSVAADNGFYKTADILVKNGARLNYTYPDGDGYLHKAVKSGKVGGVATFLDLGSPVDGLNRRGFTPLYLAVISNNTRIMNVLLFGGANTSRTFHGESYVTLAVRCNFTEALKSLVEHKAPVDMKDANGLTALYHATLNNQTETVRLLLLGGANTSITNPLNLQRTPLHVASGRDDTEIGGLLLDYGAETDVKDVNGLTPLYLTAIYGRPGMAELLLDRGADVNACDGNGHTPLWAADHYKNQSVARLLRERGGINK